MKELWSDTFELFRRHAVLWVPSAAASVLMFVIGKLKTAGFFWLMRVLATRHSVLGGESVTGDIFLVQSQTNMIFIPISIMVGFVEICLFVVALITTDVLVQDVREEQTPKIHDAMHGVSMRAREILILSVKYMAVTAVLGAVMLVLSTSPLTNERLHSFTLSKPFVYLFGLIGQLCLAWLLVPSAIRLLRPADSLAISLGARQLGTAFAVGAFTGGLALEFLLGKAEAKMIFDQAWERDAIGVINTLIVNAPMALLFIALSLLALQDLKEGQPLAGLPSMESPALDL